MDKKNKTLLIEPFGIGHIVAIKEAGQLVDLYCDVADINHIYPMSAIVCARVTRRLKKMGGYFLLLPNGKQGYLKSRKNFTIGSVVKVQAKAITDIGKPQSFTDNIKLEGEFFIVENGQGKVFFSNKISDDTFRKKVQNEIIYCIKSKISNLNVLVRSKSEILCLENFKNELIDQIMEFKKLYPANESELKLVSAGKLSKERALNTFDWENDCQIIEGNNIFDENYLWDEVEQFLSEKYFFGNESYLIIEQTAAFCSIDINSGNDFITPSSEINIMACYEIFRNIRVRGIGGKIIIDFISCSKIYKKAIYQLMNDLSKLESYNISVKGWTKLGNFEIESPYERIPLKYILRD